MSLFAVPSNEQEYTQALGLWAEMTGQLDDSNPKPLYYAERFSPLIRPSPVLVGACSCRVANAIRGSWSRSRTKFLPGPG